MSAWRMVRLGASGVLLIAIMLPGCGAGGASGSPDGDRDAANMEGGALDAGSEGSVGGDAGVDGGVEDGAADVGGVDDTGVADPDSILTTGHTIVPTHPLETEQTEEDPRVPAQLASLIEGGYGEYTRGSGEPIVDRTMGEATP
jgi:hypothetical protein